MGFCYPEKPCNKFNNTSHSCALYDGLSMKEQIRKHLFSRPFFFFWRGGGENLKNLLSSPFFFGGGEKIKLFSPPHYGVCVHKVYLYSLQCGREKSSVFSPPKVFHFFSSPPPPQKKMVVKFFFYFFSPPPPKKKVKRKFFIFSP